MALNPNVVVVAPGELITSAHLNNIRANLERLDTAKVDRAGDTIAGPLTVTGSTMLTSTVRINPPLPSTGGVEIQTTGFTRAIVTSGSLVGTPNVQLCRAGPAIDAVAQPYQAFYRSVNPVTPTEFLGGSIAVAGISSVVYNTTSDKRLKRLTRNVDPGEAVDKVAAMEPVNYVWIADPGAGEQIGLFAQDLYPIAPEAITPGVGEPGDDGFVPWQIDVSRLVPTLVAAIQAHTQRIEALEEAGTSS